MGSDRPGQGTGAGLVIVLGLVVGVGFVSFILWSVFSIGLGLGAWAGSRFRARP
jgi:hypothetical protein